MCAQTCAPKPVQSFLVFSSRFGGRFKNASSEPVQQCQSHELKRGDIRCAPRLVAKKQAMTQISLCGTERRMMRQRRHQKSGIEKTPTFPPSRGLQASYRQPRPPCSEAYAPNYDNTYYVFWQIYAKFVKNCPGWLTVGFSCVGYATSVMRSVPKFAMARNFWALGLL
jgi:hypothetical protein